MAAQHKRPGRTARMERQATARRKAELYLAQQGIVYQDLEQWESLIARRLAGAKFGPARVA